MNVIVYIKFYVFADQKQNIKWQWRKYLWLIFLANII